MQHDRPTPQELAEAVREFLQEEILPILDDHRLKFRTLVAINGLGIAERELWATTAATGGGLGAGAQDPGRRRAGERRRAPEGAGRAEAPRLEPTSPREVRVRRRLYLMRHADVSYVDEAGPAGEPGARAAHRARARAGRGRARRVRRRRARPRRLERPAAHGRDGGDRRARTRGRALARVLRVARRPARRAPARGARVALRRRSPRHRRGRTLPRRRVARRGARPDPPRARPARRARVGHGPRASSTAASTGSSSPTPSPATGRTSAPSSRRPRASTCSTSATTAGSCAPSTTCPTTRSTRRATTTMEHLWEQLRAYST